MNMNMDTLIDVKWSEHEYEHGYTYRCKME